MSSESRAGLLIPPQDLAQELGVSEGHLAQMRYLGTGPKFVKVGRAVRYRRADVEAYLDAQTFASTAGAR